MHGLNSHVTVTLMSSELICRAGHAPFLPRHWRASLGKGCNVELVIAVLGTRHIFIDASPRHAVFPGRHRGVFSTFFHAFTSLNLFQCQLGRTATFHPSWRSYSTCLLVVNLHLYPWRPSHPSWRSTSIGQTLNPPLSPPTACGVSRGER